MKSTKYRPPIVTHAHGWAMHMVGCVVYMTAYMCAPQCVSGLKVFPACSGELGIILFRFLLPMTRMWCNRMFHCFGKFASEWDLLGRKLWVFRTVYFGNIHPYINIRIYNYINLLKIDKPLPNFSHDLKY